MHIWILSGNKQTQNGMMILRPWNNPTHHNHREGIPGIVMLTLVLRSMARRVTGHDLIHGSRDFVVYHGGQAEQKVNRCNINLGAVSGDKQMPPRRRYEKKTVW